MTVLVRYFTLQICVLVLLAVTLADNSNNVGEENDNPCMTKSVTGPCRAYLQRWAWDSIRKDCVRFIYGGCQGNGNNFLTKEECVDSCLTKIEPTKTKKGVCPLLKDDGMCENMCEYDDSCPGDLKCCSNDCGRVCHAPADPGVFEPEGKPGKCPSKSANSDPENGCLDVCYIDDQCPGHQKCCPNHCGSSCVDSITDVEPECAKNWTTHNGTCYKFVSESVSHIKASTHCSHLHPQAHLAYLKTEWEVTWVKSFLRKLDDFENDIGVWIGLRVENHELIWNDGSLLTYSTEYNVEILEQNDPCLCLHDSTDGYNTVSCDDEKQYLCQYQLQDISAQQQSNEDSNKNFVVDMYIVVGITATVILSLFVVGLLLYKKYRRRVIWTGDNERTVVKYEGYEPVLL
ncbi:uncharacterized protein LOC144447374 isoform X2 [Glandiceps talaboti]